MSEWLLQEMRSHSSGYSPTPRPPPPRVMKAWLLLHKIQITTANSLKPVEPTGRQVLSVQLKPPGPVWGCTSEKQMLCEVFTSARWKIKAYISRMKWWSTSQASQTYTVGLRVCFDYQRLWDKSINYIPDVWYKRPHSWHAEGCLVHCAHVWTLHDAKLLSFVYFNLD